MKINSNETIPLMASSALAPFIFIPILLYPPLLFTDQISASIRISMFVLLIMYLLSATKRVSKNDVVIIILLSVLSASLIATNIFNNYDLDELRVVGSTMLTLVFAWALSRCVKSNERIKLNLVKFYTNLFLIVPVCSFLSIIYFLIFGELNLFNLDPGGHDTYIFTPFGALQRKDFGGVVVVYRSFSFFTEPVNLALFYAANIFLVAPHLKKESKFFLVLNIIGGILTFSFLFYVLSSLLYFSKNIKIKAIMLFLLILILIIAVIFTSQVDLFASQINIFSSSSLTERIDRINLFFTSVEDATVWQFLFGRGFIQDTGFDRGFAAGLFTSIYEIGFCGLSIILFFFIRLSSRKLYILLLFIITQLVLEPTKLPLFWVLVVVLTVLLPDKPQLRLRKI